MAELTAMMTIRMSGRSATMVGNLVRDALTLGLAASAQPVEGKPDTFDVLVHASGADAGDALNALQRVLTQVNLL